MIAFVSTTQKLVLLTEEQKQSAYEVISNTSDINKLVLSLKNAYHYTQIIIDISIFDNDDSKIINSLYQLKSMNSTKLIILAQGKCIGDTFLSELVKIGIYNFVLSFDEHTAVQEMQACINGVEYENVKHFIIEESSPKKSIFARKIAPKQREVITIGIGGIFSRIGTTTQSIRLVRSLVNNGRKACYVEQNNNEHVAIIKDVFVGSEQEFTGFITFSDIPMYSKSTVELDNLYDYIVCDYGVLCIDNIELFAQCSINIIIAGSTAWELMFLPLLKSQFETANYIFSFTDKKAQEDILDFMKSCWTNTYFAEYSPDMFSELSDVEKQMYKRIVLNKRK